MCGCAELMHSRNAPGIQIAVVKKNGEKIPAAHYYGNQTVICLHHISSPGELISGSQCISYSPELVVAGVDE